MKVFVSKYALTSGIEEVFTEGDGRRVARRIGSTQCFFGEGNEWHYTKAAAIAKAEEMRLKKIVSLEKQLAKMRTLKFCDRIDAASERAAKSTLLLGGKP